VSKITEKAVCRSVFFTICTPSDCFFGDFAHWAGIREKVIELIYVTYSFSGGNPVAYKYLFQSIFFNFS